MDCGLVFTSQSYHTAPVGHRTAILALTAKFAANRRCGANCGDVWGPVGHCLGEIRCFFRRQRIRQRVGVSPAFVVSVRPDNAPLFLRLLGWYR